MNAQETAGITLCWTVSAGLTVVAVNSYSREVNFFFSCFLSSFLNFLSHML